MRSIIVDKAVWAYNGLDPETVRVMKDTPDIIKQLDEWIITKESIKNDLVGSVEQVKQQKKRCMRYISKCV